jgi:alanine-synthesizing transaminase
MFSSRVPADLGPNAVAVAVERMRCAGEWFDDLTGSNPTTAGFDYPAGLLQPLAGEAGLTYDPQPFGLMTAREAVAADYLRRGLHVAAQHLVLTASTSESYALLFKLLCDAGDAVLVPTPSYPLFEHLSRLDLVHARPYVTEFHGSWQLDMASVRQTVDERTRAILVVSPNNPTGAWLKSNELDELIDLCAERQIALIADEVFCDYPIRPGAGSVASALERNEALVFCLGGLSKSVGLPQMKLGWIAAAGPARRLQAALQRLEIIADTYLSVATPVQLAAASLLRDGRAIRRQIHRRLVDNYRLLSETAARYPACRVLPVEGGWSAVLQTPVTMPADQRVVRLLEAARVLVHPGYFFDFPRDGYFVLSLLTPPDVFAPAIDRLFAGLDE